MKALVWCAPYNVKVENVPDPKILVSATRSFA